MYLKKIIAHGFKSFADKIIFDSPGEYRYTSPSFDKITVDTSSFVHTNDGPVLQEFFNYVGRKEFDALRDFNEFKKWKYICWTKN